MRSGAAASLEALAIERESHNIHQPLLSLRKFRTAQLLAYDG